MFGFGKPTTLPTPDQALRGRDEQPWQLGEHVVLKTPVVSDEVPEGHEVAVFGLGCFWGAEEIYWQVPGVWSTSVGYAGGSTPHPTYEEVCSGKTGHTEAIRLVFDPAVVSFADLVKRFFEIHDPTEVDRQGPDIGTQYRSAVFITSPQQRAAIKDLTGKLEANGYAVATTVLDAGKFWLAEDYHQDYYARTHKTPYCHGPVPRFDRPAKS